MTSTDKWLILYEERLAVPLMNHSSNKTRKLTVKISDIENATSVKVEKQGKDPHMLFRIACQQTLTI